MKKFIKVFVILTVLLPLILASCSDSSSVIETKKTSASGASGSTPAAPVAADNTADEYRGPLVDVDFSVGNMYQTMDGSKAVLPAISEDAYAVNELYWKFTAVPKNGANLPGTVASETTVTDYVKGLGQTVHGFAPGVWTFTLYGYKNCENNEYDTLLYKSTGTDFELKETSLTNNVEFVVSKVQDAARGNGSITLDVGNITFRNAESYFELNADESVEAYYVTDGNKTSFTSLSQFVASDVKPGAHEVVLKFKYEGVHYAQVLNVQVYSNFDTKLTGRMDFKKLATYTNIFKDYDTEYSETTWKNKTSFTNDESVFKHTYTESELITVPVKDYFTFKGWSTATEWSDNVTTITHIPARTYEALTLNAKFVPITYTITYDMNAYLYNSTTVDGSVKTPTDIVESYDYTSDTITLTTASSRDGYKFNTWTSGTSVNDATSSSNMEIAKNTHGDLRFIASWTANKYKVRFTTGTGGGGTTFATGTMADEEFTYDDDPKALTQNEFTKDGYTFKHWKRTDITTTTTFTDKQAVQNLTTKSDDVVKVEAVWTSNTYTVVYNANATSPSDASSKTAEGSTENSTFTYDKDEKLRDSGFTRTGYKFVGWTTDSDNKGTLYNTTTDYRNFTTVSNGTVNLYAKWEPRTYTITIKSNSTVSGISGVDDVVVNVVYDKTSVSDFTAPTYTSATVMGYYTSDTINGVRVLTTNSTLLEKNVSGITNANGQYTTPNNITLYTVWITDGGFEILFDTDVVYQMSDNSVTEVKNGNVTTTTACYLDKGTIRNGTIARGSTCTDISWITEVSPRISVKTEYTEIDNVTYSSPTTLKREVVNYYEAVFEGFYDDSSYSNLVIDKNGKFADTVSGFTSGGKWVCELTETTLYAKWSKGAKIDS